jgi:hypothetical protein
VCNIIVQKEIVNTQHTVFVLSIVGKIILVLNGSAVDGSGRWKETNTQSQHHQHRVAAMLDPHLVVVAFRRNAKYKKNNTRYSNVVPHRSTDLARSCLTSLSRREAVLS